MLTPARRWASIEEASAYCGISTHTLRRRISDGLIPAYRVKGGRALRIDLADVDDLISGAGRIPTAHMQARRFNE